MRNAKVWLAAVLVAVAMVGSAMLVSRPPTVVASAAPGPDERDHWRNFDGHWSYWHAGDKCWYYTDGKHWFAHDGKAWVPYKFDRGFGRGEGFVRGDYKVPVVEEIKVYAPRHEVHVYK